MSNYWHIQLHPGHLECFDEEQFNKAMEEGIIGMKRGWDNDGGMPVAFRYEVAIGDIVLVLHHGASALVEVISDAYENNRSDEFWFDIVRKVKVLSREGAKYCTLYKGDWREGINPRAAFRPANNNKFILFWVSEMYKVQLEEIKTGKNIPLHSQEYLDCLKEKILSLFQEDEPLHSTINSTVNKSSETTETDNLTNITRLAIDITINIVQ